MTRRLRGNANPEPHSEIRRTIISHCCMFPSSRHFKEFFFLSAGEVSWVMLPLIRQLSINVQQMHFIIHFRIFFHLKQKTNNFPLHSRGDVNGLTEDGDRKSMLCFFIEITTHSSQGQASSRIKAHEALFWRRSSDEKQSRYNFNRIFSPQRSRSRSDFLIIICSFISILKKGFKTFVCRLVVAEFTEWEDQKHFLQSRLSKQDPNGLRIKI